jgi:hypothetical protein
MWGTDEKENAKIERRRRMEEERKAKIFDVKNRKLGVSSIRSLHTKYSRLIKLQ